MDEVKFCPRCGTARVADAVFCPKCGADLRLPVHPPPLASPDVPGPTPPTVLETRSDPTGAIKTGVTTPATELPTVDEAMSRLRELRVEQWAVIAAVGMAIGALLPWAQTNGYFSISVSALNGLGRDLTLTLGDASAVAAVIISSAMALNKQRAADVKWVRAYGVAAAGMLVSLALVVLAFGSASRSDGGLLAGFVSPGIGLLISAGSAIGGLIAIRRRLL